MTGDDVTVLLVGIVLVTALASTAGLFAVAIVAVRFYWQERRAQDPLQPRARHTDLDLGFDRLALAPWPDEVARQRAKHERLSDGGAA